MSSLCFQSLKLNILLVVFENERLFYFPRVFTFFETPCKCTTGIFVVQRSCLVRYSIKTLQRTVHQRRRSDFCSVYMAAMLVWFDGDFKPFLQIIGHGHNIIILIRLNNFILILVSCLASHLKSITPITAFGSQK